MKISRKELRKIIAESLLVEQFSAAATGVNWAGAARGLGGAVSTHGRSLLSALKAFEAAGTGTSAANFAARARPLSVMAHNMKSLTTAMNRAGGEAAFRATQNAMGQAGRQFAWQGGRMVFLGSAEAAPGAAALVSGVTTASLAVFLGAILAAFVVPGIAIYEFSTMGNLDKRLKNLHRIMSRNDKDKAIKPFGEKLISTTSLPGKELTAVLPLIFVGFGGALRDKAAKHPSLKAEPTPEALAMGDSIIQLIKDGIVDEGDLRQRFKDSFINPIVKEVKAAQEEIASLPPIPEEGDVEGFEDAVKDKPKQASRGSSAAADRIRKIQKIIGEREDGTWSTDTNAKLGAYVTAREPKVKTIPSDLEWWRDWKLGAPKIKSIEVNGKTMTFGKNAGNPALRGNLTSLLKVVEFIKDARGPVNERLSHGSLIRRRYRRY